MCILDLFGCLSLVYLFFCSFFSATQSANYQFGSPQETYLNLCFSSEIPFGISRSSRHYLKIHHVAADQRRGVQALQILLSCPLVVNYGPAIKKGGDLEHGDD